jgi:hypothetical protein
MIQLRIRRRRRADLFMLLTDKEDFLRLQKRGTFHRSGRKKTDMEKWQHSSYKGFVEFSRWNERDLAATISGKDEDEDWKLLASFVGFLDRHFRHRIRRITIDYGS